VEANEWKSWKHVRPFIKCFNETSYISLSDMNLNHLKAPRRSAFAVSTHGINALSGQARKSRHQSGCDFGCRRKFAHRKWKEAKRFFPTIFCAFRCFRSSFSSCFATAHNWFYYFAAASQSSPEHKQNTLIHSDCCSIVSSNWTQVYGHVRTFSMSQMSFVRTR